MLDYHRGESMNAETCTIVIPCHDEANRLDLDAIRTFLDAEAEVDLVLVDDGSRDGTRALLEELERSRPGRVALVLNDRNMGKAEAVRCGMKEAFAREPGTVGYWDADLSTPLEALPAFRRALEGPGIEVVFGCRLKLLGREIERRALRHYVGRVYATFVSLVLDLGVYDSQCGAKLLRANEANKALFDRPFLSRWLFDVEILARMIEQAREEPARHPARAVVELPLATWKEVEGSKVRLRDGLRALWDLVRIRSGHRLRD